MKLHDIAIARSGDKGNRATLTVIALDPGHYPLLEQLLTPERMQAHYRGIVRGHVQRHLLPTAALHSEAIVGECSCSEAQALAREQLQTWRLAIDNQAAALEVQRLAARLAAVPPMLDRDGSAKCPPLDIRVTSAAKPEAAA